MPAQKLEPLRTNKTRAALSTDPKVAFDALKTDLPLSDLVDFMGYPQVIGAVNRGLNDFNAVKDGCCLSLIMVARYMGITSALETMQDKNFHPAPRLLKKYRIIHRNLRQDLGDVLYIYKKLKTSQQGLNWPVLDAYEAQYPSSNLKEQFQEMDVMLQHKPRYTSRALLIGTKGLDGRN